MSCMRGKSHCHCHSQASLWEQACRDSMHPALEAMGQAWLPAVAEASRYSSQKQPLLAFYTVCSLEMNVKLNHGHLPFCASLVFIAWTLFWPGEEMGDSAIVEPERNPSAERWTVLMWRWWSGKRLGTSGEIMSKGLGLKWSCQTGEDPSQEDGREANCIIRSTLLRGSV